MEFAGQASSLSHMGLPVATATVFQVLLADHPIRINPDSTLGRLAKQKSFDTLLRALSISLKQIPSRLLLIGDGHAHTATREYLKAMGVLNGT